MRNNDNVIQFSRETQGVIFGALGVLAWSVSMVGTRAAAPVLGGLFVGLGRGVVGAVLAAGVLAAGRVPLPPRRHWGAIARVSAGSVVTFPVVAGLAMERVPAAHGLVFSALLPLCTAAVAVFRHGERTGRRFWLGGAVGAGAVLGFALHQGGGSLGLADLLLLVGILASAFAYAEGGRLSAELGGKVVLSWSLVFALPVVLPAWLWQIAHHPPVGTPGAWAAFAYVSVFSSYLGFLAWYRGMALGGIARTSQLQTVQPLLGLGWSAWVLGEPISLGLVSTAVTVILCVAYGRSAPPEPASGSLNTVR